MVKKKVEQGTTNKSVLLNCNIKNNIANISVKDPILFDTTGHGNFVKEWYFTTIYLNIITGWSQKIQIA